MERRKYLAITGSTLVGISGCVSEDSVPDKEVPTVDLGMQDVSVETPDVSLEVAYTSAVRMETPGDPKAVPDEGMKFLFVAMRITNVGDGRYDVTGGYFVTRVGGDPHEIVVTKNENELRGRSIPPDASASGWFMYQIPYDARQATLTIRSDVSRQFTVRFEQDSGLSGELPEQ